MKNYLPGRFAALHEAFPLLWPLLNDDDRIGRMKLLSRMNVPAVLVLDSAAEEVWQLLDAARRIGLLDQIKQMIGHQIRQIMESEGYEHVKNKPLNSSWIFASGAQYRHPDWNGFYVHRSRDVHTVERFCISDRRSLNDLSVPPDSPLIASDWTRYRRVCRPHELDFVLGAPLAEFSWNWRELCHEIRIEGYVVLGD